MTVSPLPGTVSIKLFFFPAGDFRTEVEVDRTISIDLGIRVGAIAGMGLLVWIMERDAES